MCLQGLQFTPCCKGSNQTHKGEKMKTTKLLSIFGAKISKDGNKLVLTLVSGEDKEREYYNACIKLDNSQKTKVKVEKDVAILKVKMLKERNEEETPF